MRLIHRQLLDAAVVACGAQVSALRGRMVYVSGASGFLASNLLALLLECNRVHGLGLRLAASARRPASEVALFDFLGLSPEIEWEVAPVERARLPEVPGLVVIHAASYGAPADYLRDPLATFHANTQGLLNLFAQASRLQATRFVYFSTAEVYGQPPNACIPTPEDFRGGPDLLSSRSIYGESKRMAETLGSCLAERDRVPFIALRPWNVYGPGQRWTDGRVPVEFLRQARVNGRIKLSSNGAPRRAFCYVWDALSQVLATLGSPVPVSAFNIGNPTEELSMLELARRCAVTAGLAAGAVEWDPNAQAPGLQRCLPDVTAIQSHRPDAPAYTPLETGLPALLEWLDHIKPRD